MRSFARSMHEDYIPTLKTYYTKFNSDDKVKHYMMFKELRELSRYETLFYKDNAKNDIN